MAAGEADEEREMAWVWRPPRRGHPCNSCDDPARQFEMFAALLTYIRVPSENLPRTIA